MINPKSIPPMSSVKAALENSIRAIIASNFSDAKETNQDNAYHLIMEMIELYVRRSDDAIAD